MSEDFEATTADGVPVTAGLRVWTNNLRKGVVLLHDHGPHRPYWDGPRGEGKWWFYVREDNGGVYAMDGSRVATYFPGKGPAGDG